MRIRIQFSEICVRTATIPWDLESWGYWHHMFKIERDLCLYVASYSENLYNEDNFHIPEFFWSRRRSYGETARKETLNHKKSQKMSREEEENIIPEEGSSVESKMFDCYEYHRKSSVKRKLCTVLTFTGVVAGVSLLIIFTVIRSLEILKWSNLSKKWLFLYPINYTYFCYRTFWFLVLYYGKSNFFSEESKSLS